MPHKRTRTEEGWKRREEKKKERKKTAAAAAALRGEPIWDKELEAHLTAELGKVVGECEPPAASSETGGDQTKPPFSG